MVFIDGKADWITVSDMNAVPFIPNAIAALGIAERSPSFRNEHVMRWKLVDGLTEITMFPMQVPTVNYAYIIVSTSH